MHRTIHSTMATDYEGVVHRVVHRSRARPNASSTFASGSGEGSPFDTPGPRRRGDVESHRRGTFAGGSGEKRMVLCRGDGQPSPSCTRHATRGVARAHRAFIFVLTFSPTHAANARRRVTFDGLLCSVAAHGARFAVPTTRDAIPRSKTRVGGDTEVEKPRVTRFAWNHSLICRTTSSWRS